MMSRTMKDTVDMSSIAYLFSNSWTQLELRAKREEMRT
ncbi:unnamed protein product [Medioppia subpectinata]|uniref:Uncharacterized protein n=1 Tax=Medioppia subpectinata TaxID=1979941 RepID=A0A7R9LKG2_9ACAR|nr:unnamed protein product [Medioppia subpectinata]CAG2119598.1 unnamed protein product [Medioppia subpectinata]